MGTHDEHNEPSSPVCLMQEFADELLPRPGGGAPDWTVVQAFRKAKRAELLERREALDLDDRERDAAALTERLLAAVDLRAHSVLGFYWPIRGELDLRGDRAPARRRRRRGGIARRRREERARRVLAVGAERGDAARLLEHPRPAERRFVTPDALLIPLVGYDSAGYRLGYGGGYYDRTLAALTPRPFCIGVALR